MERFLDVLQQSGGLKAACIEYGISSTTITSLRRRDRVFDILVMRILIDRPSSRPEYYERRAHALHPENSCFNWREMPHEKAEALTLE